VKKLEESLERKEKQKPPSLSALDNANSSTSKQGKTK
jgi:hypothetical protein